MMTTLTILAVLAAGVGEAPCKKEKERVTHVCKRHGKRSAVCRRAVYDHELCEAEHDSDPIGGLLGGWI